MSLGKAVLVEPLQVTLPWMVAPQLLTPVRLLHWVALTMLEREDQVVQEVLDQTVIITVVQAVLNQVKVVVVVVVRVVLITLDLLVDLLDQRHIMVAAAVAARERLAVTARIA